ncbi:TPA: hypothetical protein ACH3X2_013611 [Trebouxia sp. C0005]
MQIPKLDQKSKEEAVRSPGSPSQPQGTLPSRLKVNTPNADKPRLPMAKASLPKPPSDLKNKIKSTPSATMGLSFELADLQGQNNQSENYPSPGKGYRAGKSPAWSIWGPIPLTRQVLRPVCLPFLVVLE